MCTNWMGLSLSLILIINVQIYAYKNATQINTTKIPRGDFHSSESDHSEISNKKFNRTDNRHNEKLDSVEKIRERFYDSTSTVNEEFTDNPNPFGGEEFPDEPTDLSLSSECILARSEFYLSWWVNENGSLRIPTISRLNGSGIVDLSLNFSSEDTIYTKVLSFTTSNPGEIIRFMSMASNKLSNIPTSALNLTSATLQYLSLAGNNFHYLFENYNTSFQEFSAFPLMTDLRELDLRECHITAIQYDYFQNLPALEKLFLSHNLITEITNDVFAPLTRLRHLDLSYNNYGSNPLSLLAPGLKIDENLFINLKQLMFLDLSHSKLSNMSMMALSNLQHDIEQISLCYTGLTHLLPGMFQNKSIKVIDLSGNSELYENLTPDVFLGLELLEILVFRNASFDDFSVLSSLTRLRMLDLRFNLISNVAADNFSYFPDLEILDVGENNIYNWNSRLFANNEKLKILNLRQNNITMMNVEMLRDFYGTRFLSIGGNDYICACNLRDFYDRASRNARYQYCSNRVRREADLNEWQLPDYHYKVFLREYHVFLTYYEESYRNILGHAIINHIQPFNGDFMGFGSISEDDCDQFVNENQTHAMNFEFLLLDYSENDYKCIDNDQKRILTEDERILFFHEVESCLLNLPSTTTDDGEANEEPSTESPAAITTPDTISRELRDPFQMLYLYVIIGVPMLIIASLWFWKRADIKYFFAIFKNSIILSLDKDDKKALMMTNRKRKSKCDDFTYDVFVSYSDKDRNWVLDEFIPNIEKRAEINICLHERDFQVGLSILENIIQCMDMSRSLLLVVSESFLKSNWCAFEMHLAQHRLIETRREQLILVLLQDIPRSKRSRTLQFLMRTKTYIMWPQDNKEESKMVFWKRLKKAITLNNWEPERKVQVTKPRHSIV